MQQPHQATKRQSYTCNPNRTTVVMPNQLCSEYILGTGLGVARLCESKTALRPIAAKVSANICSTACITFTANLLSLRNTLYTRIAENKIHEVLDTAPVYKTCNLHLTLNKNNTSK